MEKLFLASARAAYEPPYAEIIEFDVEEGFGGSFDDINGTESVGRDDVTDPWHS